MKQNRLEQLLGFLNDAPDDPFNLYALATEYVKRDEDLEARAYFEQLVDNHPDYIGTYYHFGKLLERADETDKAMEIYRAGIERGEAAGKDRDVRELKDALSEAEIFADM